MSYITHKTIQTYFDALMQFDLKEKDLKGGIKTSGRVLILEDNKKKYYFKTVNR